MFCCKLSFYFIISVSVCVMWKWNTFSNAYYMSSILVIICQTKYESFSEYFIIFFIFVLVSDFEVNEVLLI